jgi:phosphoserine aminotransferase
MTKGGKLMQELFEGSTINTPSMLCVQDYLDALAWVESVGGVRGTIARSDANAAVITEWVRRTPWVDFVTRVPEMRSNTSVCLKIVDPDILGLPPETQAEVPKRIAALLDAENVAKDIAGYRAAPPGLRIWTGATVETLDVETLMPWLDWAFAEVKRSIAKAA